MSNTITENINSENMESNDNLCIIGTLFLFKLDQKINVGTIMEKVVA